MLQTFIFTHLNDRTGYSKRNCLSKPKTGKVNFLLISIQHHYNYNTLLSISFICYHAVRQDFASIKDILECFRKNQRIKSPTLE